MVSPANINIREANHKDRQNLAHLIETETFVHRHLDWKPVLDWIGKEPFLLAERGEKIIGVLSAPSDLPETAWIRLFLVQSDQQPLDVWTPLWEQVRFVLQKKSHVQTIAAIPLHNWYQHILIKSDFKLETQVIMLNWDGVTPTMNKNKYLKSIRPMLMKDIKAVRDVDSLAFDPIWQISEEMLRIAFNQAAYATLVEIDDEIIAYQISTYSSSGAHIARLAVKPMYQGKRVGSGLINDVIQQFLQRGIRRITVNTQIDNDSAVSIYSKTGFKRTGEKYPVYKYLI